MEIFGKEYGMLYSVGAMEEVRQICPDKDLGKLGEVLRDEQGGKKLACIMSKWYEKAEAMRARQRGEDYVEQPLTQEVVDLLTIEEFNALMDDAIAAMTRDRKTTVEVGEAPENGKKKEEPDAASN